MEVCAQPPACQNLSPERGRCYCKKGSGPLSVHRHMMRMLVIMATRRKNLKGEVIIIIHAYIATGTVHSITQYGTAMRAQYSHKHHVHNRGRDTKSQKCTSRMTVQ